MGMITPRYFPKAACQPNPGLANWAAPKLPLANSPTRPEMAVRALFVSRLLQIDNGHQTFCIRKQRAPLKVQLAINMNVEILYNLLPPTISPSYAIRMRQAIQEFGADIATSNKPVHLCAVGWVLRLNYLLPRR